MFRKVCVALVGVLLVGGCGSSSAGELSSPDVVDALVDAGVEAESPEVLTPDEFGVAPVVTEDATRFVVPTLCADCGGRAFVFDSTEDLESVEDAYVTLGEESGLLFSWVFVNRDRRVLVQVNGDLPEGDAREYERVVDGL